MLGGKGFVAPSDKLYIADRTEGSENDIYQYTASKKNAVIAFLDVDDRPGAGQAKYPNAKFYYDWRELFEKKISILMRLP